MFLKTLYNNTIEQLCFVVNDTFYEMYSIPFLILIYFRSCGIEDFGNPTLVSDNREIRRNRMGSWSPKLQNDLVVT